MFCPLFRSHGRTWKLRLPWQRNTGETGPSEVSGAGSPGPDASELRNLAVEPICRKHLELRYRVLPYVYSIVRECHETGLPPMRALWLHCPDDPAAAARGDRYFWGRDLLVAPVVERGGREIARDTDLATIPVYVRAGAIVPFGPVNQYSSERVKAPIQLAIYPGSDGQFVLYEDDGSTYNFRRGAFTRIRCDWADRGGSWANPPESREPSPAPPYV